MEKNVQSYEKLGKFELKTYIFIHQIIHTCKGWYYWLVIWETLGWKLSDSESSDCNALEWLRRQTLTSTCDIFTYYAAATAAKSLQSCPTLCHPIDGSPPGSSVPGILQARTLEWVAISFSNAWKGKVKVKVKLLSCVRLLAPPWTAAHQAPLSMGFSRQEYWSGVPLYNVSSVCSMLISMFIHYK